MNWIVSQIGAREHYAVPRAFHQIGQLRRLYTELWCSRIRWQYSTSLRRLSGRYHQSLSNASVTNFNFASVGWALGKYLTQPSKQNIRLNQHGQWFASKVADQLKAQHLDPTRDAFFGFSMGSLETIQFLADRGMITIVDEADPARTHDDIVAAEAEKWPGWSKEQYMHRGETYHHRRMAECKAATIVLVNSPWSQQAMIQQGVPEEKIIIVPLAYETNQTNIQIKAPQKKTLNILWVGGVRLGKGIAYLIEAAKILKNTDVRFKVVGIIGVTDMAIRSAPSNVEFIGHVPHSETEKLYRTADVFVIPTLSDGFAITQLEAMSFGLPVIATHRCGQVVTEGQDGLIVPPADPQALANAISKLNNDRQLITEMSRKAIEKSKQFTLKRYADSVNQAVRSVLDQRAGVRAVHESSAS